MSAAGTVTGNVYDKQGTANPVARRLVTRFEATLDELLARTDPASLLDLGCGEGVLTERWARRLTGRPVLGADLDDPALRARWAARTAPGLRFETVAPGDLPWDDGAFDVATAIEVLEHVPDPAHTLAELARVARRHVLVSVPREPLWRVLNVARGAYLRDLGNTPGHVNHFSRADFVRRCGRAGSVVEVRSPFPWTVVLLSVG